MARRTPYRILVVDDERLIRHVLLELLEQAGYSCSAAGDAAEARARLAEGDFDLVLCDVDMPGESGLDLVRDLRLRRPETAAVMMSGIGDARAAAASINLGVEGYLVKPFPLAEGLRSDTSALRRRAAF